VLRLVPSDWLIDLCFCALFGIKLGQRQMLPLPCLILLGARRFPTHEIAPLSSAVPRSPSSSDAWSSMASMTGAATHPPLAGAGIGCTDSTPLLHHTPGKTKTDGRKVRAGREEGSHQQVSKGRLPSSASIMLALIAVGMRRASARDVAAARRPGASSSCHTCDAQSLQHPRGLLNAR
jgi:hypothetical protein